LLGVAARATKVADRATNVGADKDSDKRQRAAIEAFAKRAGYAVAEWDWFYDADVKGEDPVTERSRFKAMLDRIAGNGVRTVIVEDPGRFAGDLIIQLTGHDYLKKLRVTLIAANTPDHFLEDTPKSSAPWPSLRGPNRSPS
jgi:DNA invertase Pin-like site-specific DNA recombinase